MIFGEGVRLFDETGRDNIELEIDRVVQTPRMTHIRYRTMK